MNRAIRGELLKLRTARLPWGLFGLGVGLSVLHTILFDSNAGGTGHTAIHSLATTAGQTQAIGIPAELLLLAAVLGVVISSGEYRHRTATSTYLAIPQRVEVLVAKAVAGCGIGLLLGLAGSAVTTTIGLSFVAAGGHHLLLSVGTIARYAVGATVGSMLLAAAGVGLGSLIRSQVGAIITVFVWGFVIEQTVGGVFSSAQSYLPITAAASLAGGADLGSGVAPLPFAAAAALVAAVATLLSVVAARTTLNGDIT